MDPERWQRVEELFHDARRLPAAEQQPFVERAAGDDPEVLEEVLSLLEHQSPGFLEGSEHLEDIAPRAGEDRPPERVGPYRILRVLGEGGMGVVYLAQQESPVRREVAVKLIRAGMDTRKVVARFEGERQALAMMSHASIARVFDAGSTEAGLPYFVMEYVPGLPVTEHCDRHRLGTRERLELFVEICHGVQHAHQKGIIHRDLKASNVLVVQEDGRPVPKIIDFGIAKATDLRRTEATAYTEIGQLVGTPEYMSPEQADLSGADVDTRTDVYALGVLLYVLLVGRLPFESETLRAAGFDELRRLIREVDPPRPSTRFGSLGDATRAISSDRRTDPGTFLRDLRGDLDWITMKALEKDRSRRYPSVSELAADVRRHLDGEPVLARPPSAIYRAGKFVRRHRVGVAAAAVVLAALVVGFAGATVGMVRAVRAERLAEAEAQRANREAAVSNSVSRYLQDIFEETDPNVRRGAALTAEELLDRGVENMTDLDQDPEVRGRLLASLGEAYRKLGLYEKAWPLLEEALLLRREALGGQSSQVMGVLNELGATAKNLDRIPEAIRYYEDALATAEGTLGPDHPDVAAILTNLGDAQLAAGDLSAARQALERSLAIREAAFGSESTEVARSLLTLGKLLLEAGDPETAVSFFRRSLELREKTLPPGDRGLGYGHYFLGLGLVETGESEGAHRHLEEAKNIWEAMHGDTQADVIQCVFDLARAAHGIGRPDEAEALFLRAIRDEAARFGSESAGMIERYEGYAKFLRDNGRVAEAIDYERRAEAIRERNPGTGRLDPAGEDSE